MPPLLLLSSEIAPNSPMKLTRLLTLAVICLLSLCLAMGLSKAFGTSPTSEYDWNLPT